ncbi:hypothetical protein [Methanospirillum purgamenti]|uniref:hypothetical protein n=1 Tax=Methanospirillum purgamenti TaxID=2834276 RepID=UPI002A24383C|nr:hypothetical protein [Methanospirillum hungatei]
MNYNSFINPDYIAGRPTGTCCFVCKKRENCPFENVGKKCTRNHEFCKGCDWWDERGCIMFQFDKKFLRM